MLKALLVVLERSSSFHRISKSITLANMRQKALNNSTVDKQSSKNIDLNQMQHMDKPTYHQINYKLNKCFKLSQIQHIMNSYRKLSSVEVCSILSKALYLWQINKKQSIYQDLFSKLIKRLLVSGKADQLPPQVLINLLKLCANSESTILKHCIPLINQIILILNDANNFETISIQYCVTLHLTCCKLINKCGNHLNKQIENINQLLIQFLKGKLHNVKTESITQFLLFFQSQKILTQNFAKAVILELLKRKQFDYRDILDHLLLCESLSIFKLVFLKVILYAIFQQNCCQMQRIQLLTHYKESQPKYKLNYNHLEPQLIHSRFQNLIKLKKLQLLDIDSHICIYIFSIFSYLNFVYSKKPDDCDKLQQKWKKQPLMFLHFIVINKLLLYQEEKIIKELINFVERFYTDLTAQNSMIILNFLLEKKKCKQLQQIPLQKALNSNTYVKIKSCFDAFVYLQLLLHNESRQLISQQIIKKIFKAISTDIFLIENIEKYAYLLSLYVMDEQQPSSQKFTHILNAYLAESLKNRYFSKEVAYKLNQQQSLCQKFNRVSFLKNDNNYLDSNYEVRRKIMVKIQRCLKNFKIVLLILGNATSLSKNKVSLLSEQLYQKMYSNFNQEIQYLNYPNYFTSEHIQLLGQIQCAFKVKFPILLEFQRKSIRIKSNPKDKIKSVIKNFQQKKPCLNDLYNLSQ